MDKTTFDGILKQNIVNSIGADVFGYIGKKPYPNYYNNSVFSAFVYQMMTYYPKHFDKYSAGKGGELNPVNNEPPKMASVASSSRFCYLALRDGTEVFGNGCKVDFEHECRIKGIIGTAPQMDAYVENGDIFIEVKCHEIFDSHKVVLKKQYKKLVIGKENGFFEKDVSVENEKEFEIPLSEFGISGNCSMLYIKQLICHLLGVRDNKKGEKATLLYLFFKPKGATENEQNEIDSLFEVLEQQIKTVFESTPIRSFAERNNIELKAVAQESEVMCRLTHKNLITLYP